MGLISKAFSDIITFSRSSNATRVGPDGTVQYAPHNLITYSEQFDNAAWTKGATSVSANAIAAPNGTVTADKVYGDGTNAGHYIRQSVTVAANTTYTVSVYAKAADINFGYISLGGTGAGGYSTFDYGTGSLGTQQASIVSRNITLVGNGWYRATIVLTTGGTVGSNYIEFSVAPTDTAGLSTTSGGVYYWGAQISQGAIAGDYTPTTSAAVYGPRFDYDPQTYAAKGLLIEEQRTNLYTYSEAFDNAAWTVSNASVTANAATAPDGTLTAERAVFSANGLLYQNNNPASAGTYTISVWVKSATGSAQNIRIFGNGANTYSSNLTVTTDWQRVSFTYTYSQATSGFTTASGATADVYMWGAQLEVGAFPTSYIPTVASTVTRSADVASVNTLSPWYNATQGTLFVEYTIPFTSGNRYVVSLDKDGSNYIEIAGNTSGNVTNLYQRQGGTLDVAITGASNVRTSGVNKLAAGFATNDFAYYLNGTSQGTDTSNTMVSGILSLEIGRYNEGAPGGYFGGCIRRIAYYPRRLTNAELQALTA